MSAIGKWPTMGQIGNGGLGGASPGGGEANTSSNAGAGEGLAKAKVGVNLPFKSITAGTGITLTGSTDELEIAASGGAAGIIEFDIRNDTGSLIPAGKNVSGPTMFSATVYQAVLTDRTNLSHAVSYLGLTTTSIADGATGKAYLIGPIANTDTSSWSAADVLYVDSTPGDSTNIPPDNTVYEIVVGQVNVVNATTGTIDARGTQSFVNHADGDGSDHSGVALNTTHRGSDGTDHANVVLNDTHRGSDGTDHANVVLNDTHRSSDGTDHANVVLNDTHRSSDGKDHSDVVLNNTHRGSDGKDHSDVLLNNTHRGSDGTDHANVVLNDTHRTSDGTDHANVVLNDSHRTGNGADHSDVALNTTHRGSDGKDHSDVVLNNTHRGSDGKDHSDVVLNNTHRGSDGKDHADVVLNNTHRGSNGTDHANVVLNDTHRGSDGKDHSDVVANTALAHARAHTIASAADHSDVTGTPVKNDTQIYDGSLWQFVPEGTDFIFSIASFTDNQSNVIEIGSGVWKAIGALTFDATYNNPPATAGDVSMSGFGNAWAGDLDMGSPYTGPTVNTEAVNFPSSPGQAVFTLTATDGVDPDTDPENVNFWNNVHYGVLALASGISEAQIEALSGKTLQNVITKNFTDTAGAGEHFWYCWPKRMGLADFAVGGFSGGFENDPPETVSVTNPSGYVEDYYCAPSTNSGLGTKTINVTAQ